MNWISSFKAVNYIFYFHLWFITKIYYEILYTCLWILQSSNTKKKRPKCQREKNQINFSTEVSIYEKICTKIKADGFILALNSLTY